MTDDLAQILEKSAKSIEGAEALFEKGLNGFAASRAYYAMFYSAEALLLSKDLSFSKHSAVIGAFGVYFAKPRLLDPMFHEHLLEAFDKRQVGDYAFDEEVSAVDARLQIDRAKAFLEAARQWLAAH